VHESVSVSTATVISNPTIAAVSGRNSAPSRSAARLAARPAKPIVSAAGCKNHTTGTILRGRIMSGGCGGGGRAIRGIGVSRRDPKLRYKTPCPWKSLTTKRLGRI